MKFKHGTRRRALEYEKDWVQRWKQDGTFEKSVEQRPKDDAYVFYDGPPFITGVPHHGTLLSSIVKDAVPRYWTMKGKRVERVWGWDCHGLPAENFVEKQLNITDRRQIVAKDGDSVPLDKDGNELPTISLEKYITKARESMVANSESWEGVIDRIGRWVDFKGAYRTMDKDFMESVWWAFKELYEKGKIYEGEKVLMYDTKFATPVSKNEVTMDNDAYQTVTDPSVFVKFKLKNDGKDIRFTKDSKVLFVCYANVARSQMGKAIYNRLSGSENAEGAGVGVKDVHPEALTIGKRNAIVAEELGVESYESSGEPALRERYGIDITDSSRVQLTSEALSQYDLVVNLAERFQTPEWLRGTNVVWWNIKDPGLVNAADERSKAANVAMDIIERNIKSLLDGTIIDDEIDATHLLAWTTTPWTLPGNTALAVNKDLEYVEVKVGDEQFILAKALVEKVLQDEKHQPLEYEVLRTMKGSELVGKTYEPLFADHGENAHKVWAADYVSAENGTGIVHLAPIYGEEDFVLAKANDIPGVHVLDDNGYYYPEVAAELYKLMPWVDPTQPLEVWENNKNIAKGLDKAGVVWKTEYIRHEYPFNPRSKQRIMYRAIPSWFFDIQGSKPLMLEQNENINWFPAHLKHGRFAKNIEQAPDWNMSRDRFWATAMPVWKGDKGSVKVVGSYAELKELSGVELEDYHRPWVDDITFEIDGEKFTRIDKVLDCWFESGSMPFAQLHYPFENKEKFEQNYPADFIVEYVGQVRAWFYYVHAVNTSLADIGAFGDTEEDQQKTEIVFVRHGQTDANLKVMQGVELTGEDDAPLNETGEKQAQKTAEDLADEQFDVILTSPYKRAIQTAEILNQKHNLEIVVENDLHERIGGNTAMTGEQWHDSFNFDTEVDFDGESVKEFFTRIYRTIEKINRKYAGKKILIVSHGGVQHGFYAYFNKLDWQGNLRIDRIKNAEYRRYSSTCEAPKNAFKNVITTGVVAGNDGRKMSKSLGNFTDPNELMDKFSADSLRFLLLSSPLLNGEDFALHDKDVGDVARKLSMIWNMYDFFTMYAEVDGWEFNGELKDPLENLTNPLDIWIVSRLHQLVAEVERNMDVYNIPDAISPILPFLDDASNWYVRRSRRRFWKSEDDSDKSDAYQTLHYVLTRLSYILAPFTPFLAEELYHNMTGDDESIHLKNWLPARQVNSKVVDDMARTRELINTGLGLRMKKDENQDSIKVRQPLQFASYAGKKLDDYYEQIMAEELNVKEIHWIENLDKHLTENDQAEGKIEPETWLEISKKLTPELKREGLSREVIRFVQSARKKSGLNVDDRIILSLETSDDQLCQAIEDFRQIITSETLADRFENLEDSYQETVKIDNVELKISLKKS